MIFAKMISQVMKVIQVSILFLIIGAMISCSNSGILEYKLENDKMSRVLIVENGKIRTGEIRNKVKGKKLSFDSFEEFQLRISKGTHTLNTDQVIGAEGFDFRKVLTSSDSSYSFELINKEHGLKVHLFYELGKDDFYARKSLKIFPENDVTIERIDLEVIDGGIMQPYQIKQITAQGPAQWKPGLGQPLYADDESFFLGTEFPASTNYVETGTAYCGYLWGREVKGGEAYTTYPSVIGVGKAEGFIEDEFLAYIDEVRIRPLRLQVQYNSWFDFGSGVDKRKFGKSVSKVHEELVEKRGVPPLKAYVIDDGWQDVQADWSDKVWKTNSKFNTDFSESFKRVKGANAQLGLWMSPGCLFGAQPAAQKLGEQGFEKLENWMSMAGPKYMGLLEERMLELTEEGVGYFKLDGLFGHLNTREFELHGDKYGIPYMPQLGTDTLKASDEALNARKYDELKTYYLVAGTERLMDIFKKQHEIDPDIYIVISNGAYLSPWWLMYIDAVWMINAGDAAEGSSRTEEMAYRDGVYHDIWKKENTQFPMHSIFNHEPKKTETGETPEAFSEYLWMNLSRGTGFVELYIKTEALSQQDWDVMAEGLKWVHKVFPYFKNVKMHGGDPNISEVYGYCGWNEFGGYLSVHNPDRKNKKTYRIQFDRNIGIIKTDKVYQISSSIHNGKELTGQEFKYGDEVIISLDPGEVKVFDFHAL